LNLKVFTGQGCQKPSVDGQAQLDAGGEAAINSRAKHVANFGPSYF